MNTSNEYEAPDLKRNSKPLLRSAFERTSQSFNLTQRRNKGILSLFLWLALSLFFIASTNNVYAQDTDGDGVLDSVDLDGDNDGILDAV